MSMTLDQLSKEALSLSSADRARLADRLVESLDSAALGDIDRLWAAEAARRLAEIRSGSHSVVAFSS